MEGTGIREKILSKEKQLSNATSYSNRGAFLQLEKWEGFGPESQTEIPVAGRIPNGEGGWEGKGY